LKFYDLAERLLGKMPRLPSSDTTRIRSAVELADWLGLPSRSYLSHLPGPPGAARRELGELRAFRARLVEEGHLLEAEVEGEREPAVLVPSARHQLEAVTAGEVPAEWRPLSEVPEAVFLGPLDIVSARGRARPLFGFDYKWEVYTPPARRRWAYYVLPVLLGDRLVGRIEPIRSERGSALVVRRAWWEDGVTPSELVAPLARGLTRSAAGLGLSRIRVGRVGPASFRAELARQLQREIRSGTFPLADERLSS
ncbi:MAG: winged helix DNA-binding domain-containing protein, partial [Thermoplasmata archaeon]|nr:winged helix DNA-binding domain-containing protein [Thermoplasmata archaeon]